MTTWIAVLVASVGCYLLKVTGLLVPARWLASSRARALTAAIPVALLTAIIALQTVADENRLVLDARLPGVLVAVVAVWRRAPFPVVVIAAAATTALIRAAS